MHFLFYLAAFGGFLYLAYKNDRTTEKIRALEERLKWTETRTWLLFNFICESSTLQDDAKKFIARGYHCGHDGFSEASKGCQCTSLGGRMSSKVDKVDFYEYLEEKKPTDFESDGGYLYDLDQDKEEAKENQQVLLPYFQKLNRIAPKAITNEHINWLMRDGLQIVQIGRYLEWLLPSLHDGFNRISDPEGKKTLAELEELLGGNIGHLADRISLIRRPPKASTDLKTATPNSVQLKEDGSTYPAVAELETVLVVEDEPTVRDYLIDVLRQKGYVVMEASDGEAALALYRNKKDEIDIVLTDLEMPKMGGRELAREIESISPGAKIIYLSSSLDAPALTIDINREGKHLINKPFPLNKLFSTIRKVLEG